MHVESKLIKNKAFSVKARQFDVAIIGAGIGGSMLAAILAKHGVHVSLIDAEFHPRFAIGESTVPHTSKMLQLMADRYDIPELKNLATSQDVQEKVVSSCGIKRGFGFVHHCQEKAQNPQHVTQSLIPGIPESHWYRQDIDTYMFNTAIRYGTESQQGTRIADLCINEHGVDLKTESGEKISTRYLVDASGRSSLLAQKFDLRETPTRLKTHSRVLFTHMIGVKGYENCVHPKDVHSMPAPWSECTLHHIFNGGWMWVIPFNNHENATNPLCSVGLCLDTRRFPRSNMPPEQEFQQFLYRFPEFSKQFEDAKSVRNWTVTNRLQYSPKKCVSDRYCLSMHAAGFIDPLFSRGLANTAQIVDALANRILQAITDDDFSAERFNYIEQLQQSILDYNDQLVNCAYISFVDFDLWNAWFRVWALGMGLGAVRLAGMHKKFLNTLNPTFLPDADEPSGFFHISPRHEEFKNLWNAAVAEIESVEEKKIPPKYAAQRILTMLDEADFVPHILNLSDSERRSIDFSGIDLEQYFQVD